MSGNAASARLRGDPVNNSWCCLGCLGCFLHAPECIPKHARIHFALLFLSEGEKPQARPGQQSKKELSPLRGLKVMVNSVNRDGVKETCGEKDGSRNKSKGCNARRGKPCYSCGDGVVSFHSRFVFLVCFHPNSHWHGE